MLNLLSGKFVFPSQLSEDVINKISLYEELYHNATKDDIELISAEDKIKHINLQFLLLFSSNSFYDYFYYYSRTPDINSNKILVKFVTMLNSFIPKSK